MRTRRLTIKFPRKLKKKITKWVRSKGFKNISQYIIISILSNETTAKLILDDLQERMLRELDKELLDKMRSNYA